MRQEMVRYQAPTNPEFQHQEDQRDAAYEAGRELAQMLSPGRGELVRPDMHNGFDHPFFKGGFSQGQQKRVQTHKRTVHVVSETEYILTEETTVTETFSFGDDIYRK